MQRYDVCVLAPRLIGGRQALSEKVLRRSRKSWEDAKLVFREELFCPDRLPFQIKLCSYQLLTNIGFRKVVRNWGMPDLIHAHVVYPAGCAAVRLGKQVALPVILTEHTGPFSIYLNRPDQKRAVFGAMLGASRVLAVSPALAKEIHAAFPDVHVDVLGNVVMTRFFEPREGRGKRGGSSATAFLCVALFNRGKGVDDLLTASRLLLKDGLSSFEVWIGGDGIELPRLRRLAETLGLQGYCKFLGMLTRSEVRSWMRKTDVFVLPSLHETFGLVAGEAMACGKPVIATRCGGPEFVITSDTGVLVNRADPVGLAEAMKAFIVYGMSFDSEHIREQVKARFGEATFLQRVSAIYEQVLEDRSSPRGRGHIV